MNSKENTAFGLTKFLPFFALGTCLFSLWNSCLEPVTVGQLSAPSEWDLRGILGFLSVGTPCHSSLAVLWTWGNQCPLQRQGRTTPEELNSGAARESDEEHLGGLGGLPGTLGAPAHLCESDQAAPSSGWESTQPFVSENRKEAAGWVQGSLKTLK